MKTREEIIKGLVKNKKVLDLGAGTGEFGYFIAEHSKTYYDLDINVCHFHQDLNSPFNLSEKFDVVVAGELIEHLENTEIFLNNVKRHLKKNGIFFLTTPNPTSFRFFFYALLNREPDFSGHIKYFTKDALILLLKKYFKVIEIGFNNYTTNQTNKHNLSWKIKYRIENFVGNIIKRLSPDIYVICKN
jgi:2-polyprenyl-3-methyl-5-hydroxy-6-metoxy-1,4-benzoquinol methylase